MSENETERDVAAIIVDALNEAFQRDPQAIHSLLCNRVPCNAVLADDPYVCVEPTPRLVDKRYYTVGTLGLVNGVLAAAGLPLVNVVRGSG